MANAIQIQVGSGTPLLIADGNCRGNIAPYYSNQATYVVGQKVWYEDVLKECTYPITTPEEFNGYHWRDVKLANSVTGSEKYTAYSDDILGSFYGSLIDMQYPKRAIGYFTIRTVGQHVDSFPTTGSRAIYQIDPEILVGKVHIYNPDQYTVGVYYRKKSDNEYVDYAVTATNAGYLEFTPNDSYNYFVIAIHFTGGTETVWTTAEVETLNRRIFVYSGNYIPEEDFYPFTKPTNLISPSIIHIGKYYYENGMANNANMAYTDLIPIRENHTYYFPYLTLGYAWYDKFSNLLGGGYAAVEDVDAALPYKTLVAPPGAAFVGVSVRSGDAPNMVLSEIPDSKAKVSKAVTFPIAKSVIVREPLNWLYNTDFVRTQAGSRLVAQNGATFDGTCMTMPQGATLFSYDHVTMDKSKMTFIFAVPSGQTPNFVIGDNGYYATGGGLSISDGSIAVEFLANGTQAEVRYGIGNGGNYATVLETLDISAVSVFSGKKICVSIEKDTINKYVISIYGAETPGTVVTYTHQATQASDANLYTGQIRGWGGPFLRSFSGTLKLYRVQMYSTAPTYPNVAVWGDSYIENMGRNPNCSYANLLRDALDGNAFLSGRGGATAAQVKRRLAIEINLCAPQYIIFNAGVNESFSGTASTVFTQVEELVAMAKAKGAVPVLVTVPRINTGSSDNNTFIQAYNPLVRASGYDYIDIAYALSTGDGVTQDTSKFVADKTHPNLAGGQAIFNYIKAFLPQLLWK